ncbi:MAG: hypothetical protein RLZZ241_1352 [Bacteroidota bacterium]|jgi:hypothetical protein
MIKKVSNNKLQVLPKEDWYHRLSIQVSLNGLSFCVLNTIEQTLEVNYANRFKAQVTPFQLQQALKDNFTAHDILKYNYSEVLVIHDNLLYSLVPTPLFDAEQLPNYIKYNARILPTDHLDYDHLSALDIHNVFVPYTNINNYVFDLFGAFEFKHASTVLLETLAKIHGANQETLGYVHLSENQMDLTIFSQKRLRYFNRFEITSETDFLYYLLFAMEQLDENPSNIKLRFVGDASHTSTYFEIANNYFEHVSILLPQTNLADQTQVTADIDFTLMHSL